MTLPAQPPYYGPVGSDEAWRAMFQSIKIGEVGWRAYAVQCVVGVAPDGDWGPLTDRAVRDFQKRYSLAVDGVVGPATQAMMIRSEAKRVDGRHTSLPAGLLLGFAEKEGTMLLAATNWYTPPGGSPGVHCGVVQWRHYGPPFDPAGLRAAFDPDLNMEHAAATFEARLTDYTRRRPGLGRRRLVETAVLAHNAPFLAEQIVRNGQLSTPDALAVWTTKPGGGSYTHAEWAVVYPAGILEGVTY